MLDHPTYEFTNSNGGVHVVDGWYSDWGHHTTIDINVPVFTTWLHGVEFKEVSAVAEYLGIDHLAGERLWQEYLRQVIDSAAYCSTEQELNDNLAWALLDASAGSE